MSFRIEKVILYTLIKISSNKKEVLMMVDVERIQKINNLALELMKQGLVPDREAAISQAEKIFRNKDAEEYSSMREAMAEVQSSKKDVSVKEAPANLSADQVSKILETNTKYIVCKLKDFQEKIVYLQREIETLKTKMNYQKLPTVNEIVSKTSAETNGMAKKERNFSIEEERKPVAPSHPRSGNYKEDDVSIEKFFYMGSK